MSKGRTETEFWHLTPRQLSQFFQACDQKTRDEHNARMSLAWHIAWLGFHDPKKLPKLKSLLISVEPRRRQSVAEMEEAIRALGRLGGKVVRN